MSEPIDCPLCGGQSFSPLFVKQGEPFVRCNGCTLMLINPRPDTDAVELTYDPAYSGHYIKKADKKLKRCRRWVDRIRRGFVADGNWLDVGCSAGFVVAAARDAGFNAYGVELEPAAVAYAQQQLGLEHVVAGQVEKQQYPSAFFNVISLYDVIEHVPDLNVVVAELKRILAPSGVIEIRTPDLGHWLTPSNLSEWKEVKPSEHLYYFDSGTLVALFARHELAVAKQRFMFKPALDIFFRHA